YNYRDARTMRHLTLLLSVLFCAGAFAQAPASAPAPAPGIIPLEHFTKFDEFGGVKISPDAAFLAVLTGKYGRSKILFVDLQNKKNMAAIEVPQDCEIDE